MVAAARALTDTRRIATATNRIFSTVPASSNCYDDLVSVLPVQRPAEIADYRTVARFPCYSLLHWHWRRLRRSD